MREPAGDLLVAGLETVEDDSESVAKAVAGGVCHRAKNDLQTIANILSLAGPLAQNPEDLAEAVEGRVVALSVCYTLVAEKWEPPHLDRLAEEILRRDLWRASAQTRVERQLDPLELSLRLCSPLSLWLHEMIINSLEHGLTAVSRPVLRLTGRAEQGGLLLQVADNGPGLPADFDLAAKSRLGLRLAKAVASIDLRGRMELRNTEPGLEASLWVPQAEFAALNRETWR